jgi:hypothetical protein
MGDYYTDELNKYYNQLQGRNATPDELSAWRLPIENDGWLNAIGAIRTGKGPPGSTLPATAPTTTPPEEGGGDMGANIDWPTDLYPKSSSSSVSSSALPEWGSTWIKDYLSQYGPQLSGGLSKSLSALDNPVALNEAEKANLNYMANENLRPILSNLGGRGVLNSSTSQNALAKVLADLGGTSYDRAMKNQQDKINDYLKAMALLEALLGTSKVSSASSQAVSSNQWAPYGDMMNYIANMSNIG